MDEKKDRWRALGCVELGRDGNAGNIYCTRYCIDHSQQRSHLCHEIMLEEMFPCCGDKAHRHCGYMTWAIIRSEAFLFTLHMLTLVLGVVKEAGNYRENNEMLHLIHSVVETFVSILLISVRVASAWTAFYHLQKGAKNIERNLESKGEYKKHHIQGTSLRRWLLFLTSHGAFLVLFLIGTFLIFFYRANLGWTILTNQFALIMIGLASGLFMARVLKAEVGIREDHYKVVLFEAMLLLHELHQASTNKNVPPRDKKIIELQVIDFCKAFRDTELFEQPHHIKIDGRYIPTHNVIVNAMIQSSV